MKKETGFKKGVGKLSSEQITSKEGSEIARPDVEALQNSLYEGKTQVRANDGRRGVDIVEDKRLDPYAKVKTTKAHQDSSAHGSPLEVEVNFDKAAHESLDE